MTRNFVLFQISMKLLIVQPREPRKWRYIPWSIFCFLDTISVKLRNWYPDIIDGHSIHSRRKKIISPPRRAISPKHLTLGEKITRRKSDFYYRIDDLKRGISRDYLQPRFGIGSVAGHIPKMKYRSSLEIQPVERIPRDRRRFPDEISRDKLHFRGKKREKVIIRRRRKRLLRGETAQHGPVSAITAVAI